MRVIARSTLQSHWEMSGREDSEGPLKAWFAEARKARWKDPADIKAKYRAASFLADNRVVFNIGGNKYRLVVHVNYEIAVVLVKFVGIDSTRIGGGGRE
jgi:mRNA interferase HigB